jgi:hypothetical protein
LAEQANYDNAIRCDPFNIKLYFFTVSKFSVWLNNNKEKGRGDIFGVEISDGKPLRNGIPKEDYHVFQIFSFAACDHF